MLVKNVKELVGLGKRLVPMRDITTLQIVNIEQSKGLFFTSNVGEGLAKDFQRLKRKGLVTWQRSKKTNGLRTYAGLRLTKKGFTQLSKATMITPARLFGPRKKR